MSTKVIIYSKPNGIIDIVTPSPERRVKQPDPNNQSKSIEVVVGGLQNALALLPRVVAQAGIVAVGANTYQVSVGDLIDPRLASMSGNDIATTAINYEIIDNSQLPANWGFRDAWEHDTSTSADKVKINQHKAVGLSLARIRAKREELFKDLDKRITVAQLENEDISPLLTEREKLKAATDTLKALDTNSDGYLSPAETDSLVYSTEVNALVI